jgi:hypothetical protein
MRCDIDQAVSSVVAWSDMRRPVVPAGGRGASLFVDATEYFQKYSFGLVTGSFLDERDLVHMSDQHAIVTLTIHHCLFDQA